MAARIGIDAIRELMRRYMDEDGSRRTVSAEGVSLDEALQSASIQLDCPVARLEYDILEKGQTGFAGFGKKPWKINAYETASKKEVARVDMSDFALDEDASVMREELAKDVDGKAFVRLASDGVLLKVTAPSGRGRKANEKQAVEKLQARAAHDYNEDLVRSVVKEALGEWTIVGSFIANPAADALLSVEITQQDMEAYVTLTPPGPGGCDLSKDVIMAWLRNSKVVYGMLDDALQGLEDDPIYKKPVLAAQGKKPVNGDDARMQFLFATDRSKVSLEERDGKVDYKELNLIQNVVEGQVLAKKTEAKKGEAGRTVFGKILPAKDGKDVPLPLGKNVHASDDGLGIIADVRGEATYIGNKVNVETVYTIPGNVDYKTGNQTFLGTIVVMGNVEDGFSVKATGNIEVRGNVGKSELAAEGDITVVQGITGKGGGSVTAGKNIWAKFIENAHITAGDSVFVSTSIINSDITAERRIICSGQKHAAIIGGRYRACEEINAKTIGTATGGADTVLEVGSDPKSRIRMEELDGKMKVFDKEIEELNKNIFTMNETKRQRKSLPDDKEALLEELVHKRGELKAELSSLKTEYDSIQSYLNTLKVRGKVSVAGRIYPGSEIVIKDIHEKLKAEYKAVTFYLENMMIKTSKYEEFDDEILKKGPPDARKSN